MIGVCQILGFFSLLELVQHPPKVSIGPPHPDPVVETSSLSAVQPPEPTYHLKLKKYLEKSKALSCLQIETIIYSCEFGDAILFYIVLYLAIELLACTGLTYAHSFLNKYSSQHLPNGSRAWFLLGTGRSWERTWINMRELVTWEAKDNVRLSIGAFSLFSNEWWLFI